MGMRECKWFTLPFIQCGEHLASIGLCARHHHLETTLSSAVDQGNVMFSRAFAPRLLFGSPGRRVGGNFVDKQSQNKNMATFSVIWTKQSGLPRGLSYTT